MRAFKLMMGSPDAMRQERHDTEETAEDILRKQDAQDDESFGRAWDREDDLADHNDNEADDYINE